MNRPNRPKEALSTLAVVAALALTGGNSTAAVIGMEGIAPEGSMAQYHQIVTDGFYLNFGSSYWGVFVDRNHPYITGGSFANSGSDYVWTDDYGYPYWSMFSVPAQPFSIQSVRASELTRVYGGGHRIEVRGADWTTRQWTHRQTLTTDDVWGFETFTFDSTWTNLLQVSFYAWTPDMAYDDIVVNEPVPEPGTMALLGAGLVALAAGRRRKR